MREAFYEIVADGIGNKQEYDRDSAGLLQKHDGRDRGLADDQLGFKLDQLFCERLQSIASGLGPTEVDFEIAVLRPS